MKHHIPQTIKILGHEYSVEFKKMRSEGDETECGESDYLKAQIIINDSLSDPAKMNTLIHELSHQIFAISGITKLVPPEMEEAICEAMGCGFLTVLMENDFSGE